MIRESWEDGEDLHSELGGNGSFYFLGDTGKSLLQGRIGFVRPVKDIYENEDDYFNYLNSGIFTGS